MVCSYCPAANSAHSDAAVGWLWELAFINGYDKRRMYSVPARETHTVKSDHGGRRRHDYSDFTKPAWKDM